MIQTEKISIVQSRLSRAKLSGCPDLSQVRDIEGRRWADVKLGLKPNFRVMIANIFLIWTMIFIGLLGFYALAKLQWPILAYSLVPFGSLWFAFWLHAYTTYFHESTHFNIASSPKLNDIVSRVFLTPFIGLDVKLYRISHWQHHRFLGLPGDTEISYRQPLTAQRILESISGFYLLRTVWIYACTYQKMDRAKLNSIPQSSARVSFVLAISIALATQFCLALLFWKVISFPTAVAWLCGFFFCNPFIGNLRQTLEHRDRYAPTDVDFSKSAHGPINRIFGTDFFSRSFGSAGFNRHLLHHWDPTISYTRFDEMENFLRQSSMNEELEKHRSTYWRAFMDIFKWK